MHLQWTFQHMAKENASMEWTLAGKGRFGEILLGQGTALERELTEPPFPLSRVRTGSSGKTNLNYLVFS